MYSVANSTPHWNQSNCFPFYILNQVLIQSSRNNNELFNLSNINQLFPQSWNDSVYNWRQKKSQSFVFGQLRPVEARNWQRVEINREAVEMPLHFSKLPEIFPNCLRCQKCSLTFLKKKRSIY